VEFIAMHYALSERDDSEYWKDVTDREFDKTIHELKATQNHGYREHITNKMYNFRFNRNDGISCISTGYGYFPLSQNTLKYTNRAEEFDYTKYLPSISALNDRCKHWNDIVKNSPTLYEFLKKEVYNEL
jgi:hypothetical protein